MRSERRERILEVLFQIRPGEGRLTFLLFLHGLSVVGAFIVGRSVRDALFLANTTRDKLPLMYIASALAVALVGFVYSRIADRVRRDLLTAGTALLFALGFVAVRIALGSPGDRVYLAFYVFVEVVGALTVIQFWTLTNDIFHARDAKRLFGIIGAGGTLANIVFGGAVGVLARRLGAENLTLLCALLLAGVAVLATRLGRRVPMRLARGRTAGRAARPAAARVFASSHLKFVAALAAFTFVTTTLVDFQFKTIAAAAYEKDELAAFFGTFYAATGALALFVQFFATSRVLSGLGVIAALAILPTFLGVGSLGILLVPGLWSATFTKGSEFVFRYTINDATTQLLFLPVPASARGGAKAFIDGVIKPAAIAGSGLLLLAYKACVGNRVGPVGVASALSALGWGLVVFKLRGHYVRSLQDTLRRRRLDLESARHHIYDGATSKVLLRALESPEPQEVLNALEMLPHATVGKADHHLVRLLANPSAEVRKCALEHLGRIGSLQHGNAVFRLFDDPEPTVRAAAIEAFCAIGHDKAVRSVRGFLKDPSPHIRAAAIASMIRYGGLDGVLAAAEALKALIGHPDAPMRCQAARVLGEIGVKNFYHPVLELMADRDPAVRREAIQAAGQLRAPELATALVYRLAREETSTDAVEALAAYGPGIEATLERVLDNRLEDPGIRRNVPRVLGRLGSPQAIETLTAHLDDPDELVRRNLYQALRRSLRTCRGLVVDRKAVGRAIDRELQRAYHAIASAEALGLQGPPDRLTPRTGKAAAEALLSSALTEKVEQCEARLFVLLSILHPEADLELIYAGFKDASAQDAPRRRANAIELLDNVLDRPLRRRIVPLLEDRDRAGRLRTASEHFALPSPEPRERLRSLLADESAWVRTCALFLAGEQRGEELQGPVIENLDHASPLVREACVAALEKMLPLPALTRAVESRVADDSPVVRERVRCILTAFDAALQAS